MGKLILKNCMIVINSVDLSDHVSQVEVAMSKDDVDTTSFAGGGGREHTAGLNGDKFTVELQQDYAAAKVDATLYPLYSNNTEFTVAVRPTNGAKATTNPEYSGTCVVLDYTPLTGSPGDLSKTSITFNVQRAPIAVATS